MTNRELDDLLQRELPGYRSVFTPAGETRMALRAIPLGGWAQGTFTGWPRLEWRGPRDYRFAQDPSAPFEFQRSTGETITPGNMRTDGGSVPRVAWSLPGLSPWDYLPAYLIHDWDFEAHHCGTSARTFDEVNRTLAEGIYTLAQTGVASADWFRIQIIYQAVSSIFGRHIWDNGTCDDPSKAAQPSRRMKLRAATNGNDLPELVADALRAHHEPWVRRFEDADGEPEAVVTQTLARVGRGLARDSIHTPVPDAIYLRQLAPWLVDTFLVNPNDPKMVYRGQFDSGVRHSFAERGSQVDDATVEVLVMLALGAYHEADLRAVRVAAPDLVARMYLQGGEMPSSRRSRTRARRPAVPAKRKPKRRPR